MLAANVIDVRITSNGVALLGVESQQATAGDSLDVTYTATQVTLTAKNGTQINVDGKTQTTHTFNTAAPLPLFIAMNGPGSTLTIKGDGQAKLPSIEVRFGNTSGGNSLTLDKVLADSVTVVGRRSNTAVTASSSTFSGPLRVLLGKQPTGSLTIEQTTINGPVRAESQRVTFIQSTVDGPLFVSQKGSDSKLTTTASTYNESVAVVQGAKGVINVNASPNGPNRFLGSEIFKGRTGERITLNVADNALVNDTPPTMIRVDSKTVTPPTAPTVDSVSAAVAPTTLTGTWDSARAQTLKVTVGTKTFTLGTDAALTSPSTGKWSLNLADVALTSGENAVTAVNTDTQGSSAQGTGKVTLTGDSAQQTAIQTFLTANQLTATKTSSGLNYVVVTQGSGPVPTKGQSLTVNYSGFLLNADGTLGTEFDSNVNPQFGHVTPFRFTLGQGRVIAGWDEAFALLPVGTVAKLFIPSAIGYGSAGSPPNIPPNSVLEFDVTLVSAQ